MKYSGNWLVWLLDALLICAKDESNVSAAMHHSGHFIAQPSSYTSQRMSIDRSVLIPKLHALAWLIHVGGHKMIELF
jgi:hypothetical protein